MKMIHQQSSVRRFRYRQGAAFLISARLAAVTVTTLALGSTIAIAQTGSAVAAVSAERADTQQSPVDRLRSDVAYLASEKLEGRMTGTEGAALASTYLVAELGKLGAHPLPGEDDFLVPFEFTAGTADEGSMIAMRAGDVARNWTGTSQVQALSFSDSAAVSGEVVFAGYGLKVPEGQDFGYDSYATLDVKDKIVLVLRYSPEDLEGDPRATLARYSGLRYKAMTARQNGAKALLVVTGPRSSNAGETIPMTFDTAISGSGITAASISAEVANALFANSLPADGSEDADKPTLESAQKALDSGNPHVAGFALPGIEVDLDVRVHRERRQGFNVAGVIDGKAPSGPVKDDKIVLIGAHYDHLGRGKSGNSLARKEEAGDIHYGADDNASGVAAALEIARRLTQAELGRKVVVAFWSGEELGLLGSSAFVRTPSLPIDQIAANVNLDMVGRMRENKLTIQAVGSSEVWPSLIERANVPVGFDINTQDDPYLPTDSASFNGAKIPSLNLFTGGHEDYHRPTDRAESINYDDLERVSRFGALLVQKLTQTPDSPSFVAVERSRQEGGDRDTVRAYTGTIPDYTTEVEGLRLGGVIGGGPADEAGLQEGDVIIEFGKQTIANIYDYTYALDAVKVGVPVKVVYLRDGERMETTITPRNRK